jgi:hypothetical protein
MMPILRLAALVALPLALAACGSNEKKAKDQRTAAGEILPGSISDSMLPYDTVRSQPPLAPKETGKPAAKAAAGPAAAAASDAAAPADAAPAVDEAPAAAASPAG